jgi:hypothetical protein
MQNFTSWLPLIFSITLAAVGFIVWLIRLEGRIMKTNTVIDMHRHSCVKKHEEEHARDTENLQAVRHSIDKLFDLVRTVQTGVDEIRGWKNGLPKT